MISVYLLQLQPQLRAIWTLRASISQAKRIDTRYRSMFHNVLLAMIKQVAYRVNNSHRKVVARLFYTAAVRSRWQSDLFPLRGDCWDHSVGNDLLWWCCGRSTCSGCMNYLYSKYVLQHTNWTLIATLQSLQKLPTYLGSPAWLDSCACSVQDKMSWFTESRT